MNSSNTLLITEDELIGLVSGSLPESEFDRVSRAVSASSELLKRLEQLEFIRDGLMHEFEPTYTEAEDKQAAQHILQKLDAPPLLPSVATPQYVPSAHAGGKPWKPPKRARWLYGALAAQALCILGLGVIALPMLHLTSTSEQSVARSDDAPVYRSTGAPEGSVMFVVNFAPTVTEREIRSLLLAAYATIVSGPTQLGEYRLAVEGNKADAALKKLQNVAAVESVKVENAKVVRP
jgi:hypothetical protein